MCLKSTDHSTTYHLNFKSPMFLNCLVLHLTVFDLMFIVRRDKTWVENANNFEIQMSRGGGGLWFWTPRTRGGSKKANFCWRPLWMAPNSILGHADYIMKGLAMSCCFIWFHLFCKLRIIIDDVSRIVWYVSQANSCPGPISGGQGKWNQDPVNWMY